MRIRKANVASWYCIQRRLYSKYSAECIQQHKSKDKDDIVISGISGRFPQCDSIAEFKECMLEEKDMLTEQTRFTSPKFLPPKYGLLKNIDKFDAHFFGISDKFTNYMDPPVRKLVEVAYESVIDAGINPETLRGTDTGVFVGAEGSDPNNYWVLKHGKDEGGFDLLGTHLCAYANQLSYVLDVHGPSLVLFTACSSSLYAMDTAVNAMLTGKCDRAIVGAVCVHLTSYQSTDFYATGAMSPTGQSRPFDRSANGCVNSEAAVALLLERKSVAKRNYATVKHIRTCSDGYKKEGAFSPSATSQALLYKKAYRESGIDPGSVVYIEAHGTGTPVGDPIELCGISDVFCNAVSRTQPLLIGSVKSNMGHSLSAAGLCGIAKVLVGAQEGIIPANLHFNEPNSQATSLLNGSIQVVAQKTPFKGGIVGVNSFGMGGTDAHLILQIDSTADKTKNSNEAKDTLHTLPTLVPFSGQTEYDLKQSLESACAQATNSNYVGLLHQINKFKISGHNYRGYGIIQSEKSTELLEPVIRIEKMESSVENRPVWIVFPGMGSQWAGMGKELMNIPTFQDSIQESTIALKNLGFDLNELLHPSNTSIFENITHAFVTITAMQIALYNTVVSMGIRPNGFIGHSFGEILCAYADGCITSEEALRIVDARGRAFEGAKEKDKPGAMAAVGLSWSEVKRRCGQFSDSNIVAACHNGPQSVTVAGTSLAIKEFVKQLQAEGVFAKEVNSCQIAAHSPLIQSSSLLCLKYLHEIYGNQSQSQGEEVKDRIRSNKWISTCFSEAECETNIVAKSASPEYFTNNFANPVLFHEAVQRIPTNAVVIEIAPQNVFRGVLKSLLPNSCSILVPMQRKADDRLLHFFTTVGDMYNAGIELDMSSLYPPLNFPVPIDTPSISPLVKWNHERSWTVPIVENVEAYTDGMLNINLNETRFHYLDGHKLDDRLVFPAAGYLHFAWKSYAASLGMDFNKVPVTFENLSFERAVILKEEKPTQIRCSLHKGTGLFEIHDNDTTVAKGRIFSPASLPQIWTDSMNSEINFDSSDQLILNQDDIYKEMGIRGYNFSGDFFSLKRTEVEGKWAEVKWNGNWVTFLDSFIGLSVIKTSLCRTSAVPVRIAALTINPIELFDFMNLTSSSNKNVMRAIPASNNCEGDRTIAPGIEMKRVTAHVVPRKEQKGDLSISAYVYTPYFNTDINSLLPKEKKIYDSITDLTLSLTAFVGIFLENCSQRKVRINEKFSNHEHYFGPLISKIFAAHPLHDSHVTSITTEREMSKLEDINEESHSPVSSNEISNILIVESNEELTSEHINSDLTFLDDINLVKPLAENLNSNAWIILHEHSGLFNPSEREAAFLDDGLQTIAYDKNTWLLKKKQPTPEQSEQIKLDSICIDGNNVQSWLPQLQTMLSSKNANVNTERNRVYLYSQNNPSSGIIGLVKCLRREPGGERIRCFFDPHGSHEINFENPNSKLQSIIDKDLIMNIVGKDGNLGSFRHIPLSKDCLTLPTKQVEHAFVNTLTVGDLSSLRWIESPLKSVPMNELCTVRYASLNFRDIMLSTAKIPQTSKHLPNSFETQIGLEFSGLDPKGQRVMGMAENTLATFVLGAKTMLWKVPENWSLEEAATVPVVYATAYYAFCDRGRMKEGQSVLIHSGTGGVGQAAINIALSMNCEVFTTVGTDEKREYIKKLFPSLKDSHIGNSRDCSFEHMIYDATQGKGVDLVLNSLAEDKLQASLNCLKIGGKFLEIGKFDILKNNPFGMEHFEKNIEVHGVDLIPLFTQTMEGKDSLMNLVADGIEKGVVKPLERTVFEKDQVEDAFRFMAAGKHMGKVLIQVQKEDSTRNSKEEKYTTVKSIPRIYFDSQKSYVVIGGLGGLGLEVSNWMTERGARKLILMSRSGVKTGYQQYCIRRWSKLGVNVQVSKADLTNFDTAEEFIKQNKDLGGIFNSSLVLKDALIGNQSVEMFNAVAAPKVKLTENLDVLTRKYVPELEYFVAFSSISAGLGNAGQSNYGLANSAMEHICHNRKNDGFSGTAIQWGVIGNVGYVAEHMKKDQEFDGMKPQRITSCLDVLDPILENSKNIETTCFSSMVIADKTGDQNSSKKISLTETVARICSIKTPLKDIDPSTTLLHLGLDSLTGTELQQLLEREFDRQLPSNKIRALTWGELCSIEKEGSQKRGSEVESNCEEIRKKEELNALKLLLNSEDKTLIKLQSSHADTHVRNATPLFLVHGADGLASPFISLASNLPCEVYAFQSKITKFNNLDEVSVLEEMVKEYTKEMKLVQPKGPYNLAGYSLGSCIAFAIATHLETVYQDKVNNLIILDGMEVFGKSKEAGMVPSVKYILEFHQDGFNLTNDEKVNILNNVDPNDFRKNMKIILDAIDTKIESVSNNNNNITDLTNPRERFETLLSLTAIVNEFYPTNTFKGNNVNFIKARSSVLSSPDAPVKDNFQKFCEARVVETFVEGDHQSFLETENVCETADKIKKILQSTDAETNAIQV